MAERVERYNAIVVGGGAMGGAAAYRLARARAGRVLLLERHAIGHDRGSSHGESRIIRLTYGHPAYVRLAREAYACWEELERDSGETFLTRTGDLFFGPADGPIAAYFESLEAAGVPFERLAPGDAERRFPAFRLPAGFAALHQAEGGILPATRCVRTQARMAAELGAEVREDEPVRSMDRRSDAIRVETDRGVYEAERLVVAGGAWTGRLLPELDLPLRVTRQEVAYFRPKGGAAAFRPDRMPVFVYLGPTEVEDDKYYGVPIFGRFGVKVARHRTTGPPVDPDSVDRRAGPEASAEVRAFIGRHLPTLADADAIDPHVCLYTVTPDEDFVIDLHPADPRIAVASPCSGHGFKFASVVGKILAELVLSGRTSSEAFEANRTKFAATRFRKAVAQ